MTPGTGSWITVASATLLASWLTGACVCVDGRLEYEVTLELRDARGQPVVGREVAMALSAPNPEATMHIADWYRVSVTDASGRATIYVDGGGCGGCGVTSSCSEKPDRPESVFLLHAARPGDWLIQEILVDPEHQLSRRDNHWQLDLGVVQVRDATSQ